MEQASVAVQLSNAVITNNMLIKIQAQMDDETFEILNSFMSPDVDDALATETGWEETILASTAHLLRTSLSRKDKQQNAQVNTSTMDPIETTVKLKRQIEEVYKRILAGGKIEL